MRIDTSAALAVPGVVGCYTAADVPGHNMFGLVVADEPFLADGELLYLGQPVAVVAADDARSAWRKAARRCGSIVSAAEPLLDLTESIRRKKFLRPAAANRPRRRRRESVRRAASAQRRVHQRRAGAVLSGVAGGDRLSRRAGPDGRPLVDAESRPRFKRVVAEMLGVGQHEVVCICKRMGGAFGGKESQAAIPAMMAALVAHKTGRPARVIYNKDDDMRVTGKRHPYRSEWEVGFDDDGRIQALRVAFYSNGGCSTDLSLAVMERTLLHTDNCYFLPHVELTGQVCFTNLPSNTAFRGFGGPQAMAVIENILESIAQHLGLDAFDVRLRNLYGVGERNVTPYGQLFDKNHLPEIFATLAAQSQYRKRRDEVARFNATSRHAPPRPGDDRREVRHLVHDEVPEPGQRAGEHLHRRHGAGLDRRHRDGPGREREDSPARGRRVRPRRPAASC